jgi:hypothetical protein
MSRVKTFVKAAAMAVLIEGLAAGCTFQSEGIGISTAGSGAVEETGGNSNNGGTGASETQSGGTGNNEIGGSGGSIGGSSGNGGQHEDGGTAGDGGVSGDGGVPATGGIIDGPSGDGGVATVGGTAGSDGGFAGEAGSGGTDIGGSGGTEAGGSGGATGGVAGMETGGSGGATGGSSGSGGIAGSGGEGPCPGVFSETFSGFLNVDAATEVGGYNIINRGPESNGISVEIQCAYDQEVIVPGLYCNESGPPAIVDLVTHGMRITVTNNSNNDDRSNADVTVGEL